MKKILYEAIGGQGKGGDGLLTILKTLSYTALKKDYHVAYYSNYNAETRGSLVEGTAILSNETIISPIVEKYTTVFAFDKPGFFSYIPKLSPGGTLIWNSSIISEVQIPDTIKSIPIPINDIAVKSGFPKIGNMLALGVYAKTSNLFSIEELLEGMKQYLPVWRQDLIPQNKKILESVFKTSHFDLFSGNFLL